MNKEKLIGFIENSFLKDLLIENDITDISYNGESVYYLHNFLGRRKADIAISEDYARDFIRQIANYSEKQFSYQTPNLQVSVGKYRISAVHPSIGRKDNDERINFSIRIGSSVLVTEKDSNFINAELKSLFNVLLNSRVSIVIGGITGCGKTELQKYLISTLPDYSRVIVIDNILELDNLRASNLDLNIWQVDERNKETTIQSLIKNALRSNPDWLVVAESRGEEMNDVLNSAMTGHPIITTIHAFDIDSMPERMSRMVLMNSVKQDYEYVLRDVNYIFRFYVYLKREINSDGKVLRYIHEIAEIDQKGHKNTIYKFDKGKKIVGCITKESLEKLSYESDSLFAKTFTKGENK